MSMRKLCFVFLCLTAIAINGQVRDDKPIIDSKNDNLDGGHVVREMKVSKPVDLGLPSGTMWAEWNVGASSQEQRGNYYAWGETEPKSYYSWKSYFDAKSKNNDQSTTGFYKFGKNKRTSIVGTTNDVAYLKWGKEWSMPTKKQIEELLSNCEVKDTVIKKVYGIKMIGPNGNYIFLPAAGLMYRRTLNEGGDDCNYWSGELEIGSSEYSSDDYAFRLHIPRNFMENHKLVFHGHSREHCSDGGSGLHLNDLVYGWYRRSGQPVRPVMSPVLPTR